MAKKKKHNQQEKYGNDENQEVSATEFDSLMKKILSVPPEKKQDKTIKK